MGTELSNQLFIMAMGEGVGKSLPVSKVVMFDKVRNCIGLLNSMVACGESHSDVSMEAVKEAMEALHSLMGVVLISDSEKEITGNSVLRGFTRKEVGKALLFVERVVNGAGYGRNPGLCTAGNLVKKTMSEIAIYGKDDSEVCKIIESAR